MAHDHWYRRASQGYSGKGSKPSGWEHHRLTKHVHAVTVESEVCFTNFGVQRYRIRSQGGVKQPSTSYEHEVRRYRLEGALGDGVFEGTAAPLEPRAGDDPPDAPPVVAQEWRIDVPDGVEVVPAMVARFLPVWLPREEGELATYFPVSEDGYPVWRPPGKNSYFPVLGAQPGVRTIVGAGRQQLPGATEPAYRYEHVEDGQAVAVTWVDRKDRPVAYEQAGLILLLAPESDARAAYKFR